jgi:hypothetical protein
MLFFEYTNFLAIFFQKIDLAFFLDYSKNISTFADDLINTITEILY